MQNQKVEDIVLKKVQSPSHQFHPIYHDHALLIQLMITEMIHINDIANKISEVDVNINLLTTHLLELVNDLSFSNEASYLNRSKGALNRLLEFTHAFYSLPHESIKNRMNLHELVHRAWVGVIQSFLLIRESKFIQDTPKKAFQLKRLQACIKALLKRIQKIPEAIAQLLFLFLDNENVVYFLVRKQTQLRSVFGAQKLEKFFAAIEKKITLEKLLTDRYQEKGFYHLCSSIKQELSLYEFCQHVTA